MTNAEREAQEIIESLIAWYRLDTKNEKSFEKFIAETANRIKRAEKRGREEAAEIAERYQPKEDENWQGSGIAEAIREEANG